MRILILGAGAVGGYFGARLAEAGADVTFLVRPARAAALAERGLIVRSPAGDLTLRPQTVAAAGPGFDIVLLSCKAFDLDSALDAVAPAVAAGAAVLPLLNGLAHIDALGRRFGAAAVMGGTVHIGATLGPAGEIVHGNRVHTFFFGEFDGAESARARRLHDAARPAKFTTEWSADIGAELWRKFAFLCPLAAGTSLMRGTVAEICRTPEGEAAMLAILTECVAVAQAEGQRSISVEALRSTVADKSSTFASSMFRDIEKGLEIEAAHIVGDMLARARRHGIAAPMLAAAWAHLATYRHRRAQAKAP